jgi:hypothetical protein
VKHYRSIAWISIVAVLLAVGCGGGTPTTAPGQDTPPAVEAPQEPTAAVTDPAEPTQAADPPGAEGPAAGAMPTIDGEITEGEYPHTATIGQVTIWWANDGTDLFIAAEAATTGWVAVGLDPEDRMMGANFILAYVADGEASFIEAFGTAPTGNVHPDDEQLGGTNDIIALEAVEADGVTRFEAQLPLDSGDEFDKPLAPGETYPIIVAHGPGSDDFTSYHAFRGHGTLTLDPAP